MTTVSAALVAAVVAGSFCWWWGRRRLAARVVALGGRPPHGVASLPTEALSVLERGAAADRAALDAARLDAATLRAALDALPLGVVVVDDRGEVLLRTRAAQVLVGARHADVLIDEAVSEHVATAARGQVRRQQLDLYGPPRRTVVVRSFPVAVAPGPVTVAQQANAAVITVEDVTDRVRLESMRTDFVANISHELRTPVGGLALLAETLQDEDDPRVVERLAGKIVVEAHRVARTIDDLLELSRLEVEGARRDDVVIGVVIAEAIDRVRAAAEHRHIGVQVRDDGRALHVSGDRRQLVSAVSNLVDNAVKYSEPGSTVDVQAELVGERVAVTVRDHGVGIPPTDLDRIFERFYRVDRARSRDTGGTGLGLAIVRHVATNHGGQVTVTSQEGVGSAFTLEIPAPPVSAPSSVSDAVIDEVA